MGIEAPQYYPRPTEGRPLFNGRIYVGNPNTDPRVVSNQKQLFIRNQDGSTTNIAQPVRTSAGGVPYLNGSPISINTTGDYSIAIDDDNGVQLFYVPLVTNLTTTAFSQQLLAATTAAEAIAVLGLGDSATRNVGDEASEVAPGIGSTIYAALISPTFTGTPIAPTPAAGTNTTQIATTEFVMAPFLESSFLDNGYQTLPGGLIIQWGFISSINQNSLATITLPLAFPARAIANYVSRNGTPSTGILYGTITIQDINSTTLNVRTGTNLNGQAASTGFFWLSIGV